MSKVKSIYSFYRKIKEITHRRSFNIIFTSLVTVFVFFLAFNSYAQEDHVINPDWEGEKEFHNIVNKVDTKTEDNSATSLGQQNVTNLWGGVVYLGGGDILDEETQEELSKSNVPYDLRRGLIGMTDDAATAIYANYPLVDVSDHLAQQWIPGYKEQISALYAADNPPTGYEELKASGISSLWSRILNLSYVFFVVIMIIAGFMIMFRHKLGGQTMVTLGNVLPKVIMSLVIATFSFAIAGLVIDFGGVLIALIVNIFGISDANPISGLGPIMGSVFRGGLGTTSGIIGGAGTALGLGALVKIGGIAAITGATTLPLVLLGVGVVGLLIALVILVIIFVGAIKVLITLFKAYFQLLISVILGPLQITLGAIPGNNAAIGNWFKSLLRNTLVFPIVFFIINLPNALLEGDSIRLRLPAKLVYEDPTTYDPNGIGITGGFFLGILKIFVLYFAAQAPKFIEGVLPPNSNKGLQAGLDSAKQNMGKIPLIGGLFK